VSQARGWSQFIIIALALHIPLFIYPVLRLSAWLDLGVWLTTLVFIPLVSSQVVSRVYLRNSSSEISRFLRRSFDLWLGISPVLLGLLLIAEIYLLVFEAERQLVALVVIGLGLIAGTAGFITAQYPVVRRVPLSSGKLSNGVSPTKNRHEPVRLVQITDVHIGSRSRRFLEQVVRRVNSLQPDYVCITGDFIDSRGVTIQELESLRSIRVPIYYCIGNHEKYEDLDDIVARLQQLGVNVLRNATQLDGQFQFIGIDDMDDALQVSRQISNINVRSDLYVVLLYHRPRGLDAAANAGVDLMISGHTHNGQIVPFNFAVKWVFPKIKGLYQRGATSLYVSSGTGTWGPIMRIGTRSEITLFELSGS
jgi:predicted MPP superfamily phosphohydrolase